MKNDGDLAFLIKSGNSFEVLMSAPPSVRVGSGSLLPLIMSLK